MRTRRSFAGREFLSLPRLCCPNRENSNLVKLGSYPSSPSCRFEDLGNKAGFWASVAGNSPPTAAPSARIVPPFGGPGRHGGTDPTGRGGRVGPCRERRLSQPESDQPL